MESDQRQCTFNEWSSSWPPIAEGAPVDYSIIRYSPHSAISDLSSSPTSAQVSSDPPENLGFNLETAWSSTGRSLRHAAMRTSPPWCIAAHMCVEWIQTPPGLLSPRPVLYPDIDACSAHDPMTAVSTHLSEPYSAIQEQFCNAPWRHAGELEPKDPTTGRSVLHRLLEEFTNENKGGISECRLCNRTFTRADRAITHLRHKHLDHRPFWCGGACGAKGWCDGFPYVFLGRT